MEATMRNCLAKLKSFIARYGLGIMGTSASAVSEGGTVYLLDHRARVECAGCGSAAAPVAFRLEGGGDSHDKRAVADLNTRLETWRPGEATPVGVLWSSWGLTFAPKSTLRLEVRCPKCGNKGELFHTGYEVKHETTSYNPFGARGNQVRAHMHVDTEYGVACMESGWRYADSPDSVQREAIIMRWIDTFLAGDQPERNMPDVRAGAHLLGVWPLLKLVDFPIDRWTVDLGETPMTVAHQARHAAICEGRPNMPSIEASADPRVNELNAIGDEFLRAKGWLRAE